MTVDCYEWEIMLDVRMRDHAWCSSLAYIKQLKNKRDQTMMTQERVFKINRVIF